MYPEYRSAGSTQVNSCRSFLQQCQFLFARQVLDRRLPAASAAAGMTGFRVNNGFRLAAIEVLGPARMLQVFLEAPLGIRADAGVQRTVVAADDVDPPSFRRSLSRRLIFGKTG